MKLIKSDIMDIGHSFGIDDDFFDDIKIQNIFKKHFQKIEFPDDRDAYYNHSRFDDYQFPIGRGVKIYLDEFNLNSVIIEETIKNANEDYVDKSYFDSLIENIRTIKITDQSLTFFSTGHFIYRTEFWVPNSYVETIGEIVECFYNAFESQDDWFREKIESLKKDLLKINAKNKLPLLTERELSFFGPDYCFLIISDEVDISSVSLKISSEFAPFHAEIDIWGSGVLKFGYVGSVLQHNNSEYAERYVYLCHTLSLYCQIATSLEGTLDRKLKEIVKNKINHNINEDYINSLNILKIYVICAVNLTDYTSLGTINQKDLEIIDADEEKRSLSAFQKNIIETCSLFVEVQDDFRNIQNEKHQEKLNNLIAYLTTLTIVSVVSGAITTIDYTNKIVPSPMKRFLILVCFLILPFFWIRGILRKK